MPDIEVMACYQEAVDKIEAKVNILVDNPAPDAPMILEHIYWIDKNDNDRLMLFNDLITFPRVIAPGEFEPNFVQSTMSSLIYFIVSICRELP